MGYRALLILSALLTASTGLTASTENAKAFYSFGYDVDRYIQNTAKYYNISEPMLRGLVKMEAGWTGNISPTGATGVGQFTVGTWNWLASSRAGKEIGMQLITAANRGTPADPRHNKYINTLATGLYAKWHMEQLLARGIYPTDANLYMAHNIGLGGLHRALLGISTAKDVKNMRRNGMKAGMTVSDFIAYQTARYTRHKHEANFNLIEFTRRLAEEAKHFIWVNPTKDNYPTQLQSSQSVKQQEEVSLPINQDISQLKPNAIKTQPVKSVGTTTKYVKSVMLTQHQNLIWQEPDEQQMVWIDPQ